MKYNLPSLPLEEWEDTKITLHLFLQVVGKIHLVLHPKKNHWWHVTYQVSPRGLYTGPIPYEDQLFSIEFDFIKHQLIIMNSKNQYENISLLSPLSLSAFYHAVIDALERIGIKVKINTKPYDSKRVKSNIPFEKDHDHRIYDNKYISRYFNVLIFLYSTFSEFSSRFIGKSTPVHVFWHTFDLAYTRFSGKKVDKILLKDMDPVSKEAYSHEVISFGFWTGDDNIPEPAFYSYTFPEPDNLSQQLLQPKKAFWQSADGSYLAILKYHDLIKYDDPKEKLLEFLESAYQAEAKLANWDIEALRSD